VREAQEKLDDVKGITPSNGSHRRSRYSSADGRRVQAFAPGAAMPSTSFT
jgi:hypothetical protein